MFPYIVVAGFDNTPRQRALHNEKKSVSFSDERVTFTEEQLKRETARCIGCGVCTTKCKFDAIHLKKKYNVESVEYFDREEVFGKYAEERKHNIAIRKAAEKA